NFADVAFGRSGLREEVVPASTATARMDLAFTMTGRAGPEGGGIDGIAEFNTDVFDSGTVAALVQRWRRVLEAVVADPDRPIARLDLLDPVERRRVLHTFNA